MFLEAAVYQDFSGSKLVYLVGDPACVFLYLVIFMTWLAHQDDQ